MKNCKLHQLICLLTLAFSFIACKKDNNPCEGVTPTGKLSQASSSSPFVFRTSGGGTITINQTAIIINHDNYPGFKLEYWGDAGPAGHPLNSANHENINGKHIKDRIDVRRTIIFPDGAKITMVASGFAGPPISISIYDGTESHRINANCNYQNILEHSSTNAGTAQQLDNAEPDGETATIEFTATGLLYVNIYTEDVAGNKVMNRVLLGEINRSLPNTVNDYYDDPRLAHT